MREVKLKQTGYRIEGHALINLWGGGQGWIEMDVGTIPLTKLCKSSLLSCINDGRFGCESVERAEVWISDLFAKGYYEHNRMIEVKGTFYRNEVYFNRGI